MRPVQLRSSSRNCIGRPGAERELSRSRSMWGEEGNLQWTKVYSPPRTSRLTSPLGQLASDTARKTPRYSKKSCCRKEYTRAVRTMQPERYSKPPPETFHLFPCQPLRRASPLGNPFCFCARATKTPTNGDREVKRAVVLKACIRFGL